MTGVCPHCGQEMPWNGVSFPPLKARIFAAVKRAGPDGIAWEELYALIYGEWRPGGRERLKSHTSQINELLEDSGLRISGRGGAYVLRKL